MQVQSIQSTSINNNSFKAHFIENGYLRTIWNNSNKTEYLANKVLCLNDYYKGHTLEITHLNILKDNFVPEYECKIFNHRTGKELNCQTFFDYGLSGIINFLLSDDAKKFFNESDMGAITYQRLTGQKVYFSQKKRKEN